MPNQEELATHLLHKLFDDLKREVPELGEVTYEAAPDEVGTASLGPNGFRLWLGIHVLPSDANPAQAYRFRLEAKLNNAQGQEVCRNGWIKTEDSATKILALVKYFATVAAAP